MKVALLAIGLASLSGCASVSALPKDASAIDFSSQAFGQTGWAQHQDSLFVRGIDRQTAFLAAKDGLSVASFTLKEGDPARGFVKGERGMTLYDWNVVAGVYFAPVNDGFAFKVIAEGSKDVGFWGDATGSSWPQDILRGIQNYIARESSITNPDRGVFSTAPGSSQ